MRKPKIQSLIPCILCGCDVVNSLLLRHPRPLPISVTVTQYIVDLGQGVHGDVGADQSEKHSVALHIARSVPWNGCLISQGIRTPYPW